MSWQSVFEYSCIAILFVCFMGLALTLGGYLNGNRRIKEMSGLARICKMYGGMKVTVNGKTVEYTYDYVKDRPRKKKKAWEERGERTTRIQRSGKPGQR